MNKATRHNLLLFLLTLSALIHITQTAALACSCGKELPIKETFEGTDAVFTGEVIEISQATQANFGLPAGESDWKLCKNEVLVVMFQVNEWLKGGQQPTCQVITNPDTTACGFPFKVGERYLVYAGNWRKVAGDPDIAAAIQREMARIPKSLKQEEELFNESLPEFVTGVCTRTTGLASFDAQEDLKIIR